jgi:DNA-binding CsgD family transcriptional regulator
MTYSPRLGLPLDAALAQALARATRSIGEPGFFDAMLDLLGTVCTTDSGGAMLFFRDQRPRRLLHRYNAAERKLPEDSYLDGPYALDPHYQRFMQGAGSGVYWLRDVAPDDFFDSEYHRLFYSQIGLSDSVDLMWRIDDDAALLFFVERSVRNPPFQPADLAALQLLQPFVEAACAKHHAAATPAVRPEWDTLTHRKVQRTIENFGRSLLTQRERQVLFYMLSGYSSALTGQRLATSEGTIKIHRKNIHRKLDIGSQAELFALFIKCIPFASPEDDAADPLEAYQSKPARR